MSYQAELEFAIQLAREAGDIMRKYFRTADIDTVWKSDNSPLTIADTAINELVIQNVKTTFPTHGVIGEEDSYETKRDFVWVVDPIDGTVPFSLGMPFSTFSLGLVDRSDGQPVVAVTYDPYLDELYHAVTGQGALKNDKPIHTNDAVDFPQQYFSIVGGTEQNERVQFLSGKCIDIVRGEYAGKCMSLQSHVYFASRVASGDLTGAIIGYGSPWDSAAVALLTTEAGGVATDLEGNIRRYDEFSEGCVLAANQTMLDKLLTIIQQSKP